MVLLSHELKTIGVAVMVEVAKSSDFATPLCEHFPDFADVIGERPVGTDEWRIAVIRFFNDRKDEMVSFLEKHQEKSTLISRLIAFYWGKFTNGKEFTGTREVMAKVGPDMWLDLHLFAIAWDGNISEATSFLTDFAAKIPCGICREHWLSMCKQTPPKLASRDTFFEWTVARHNDVNSRLGKNLMMVAEAYVRYKLSIHDFFDEIYVVNLDRRPDRMEEFNREIARSHWPLKKPVRFRAIDAAAVPVPYGWHSGGGAWGCMQSHRQILETVMMNKSDSVLIFEDDAIFVEGFSKKLFDFLRNVPKPWDKIMLGGQLFDGHSRSEPVNQYVRKVVNCQRTHAYAVRGEFMRALYQKWHSSYGHCDHIMGPFQEGWNVYAPTEFLVGQGESHSDISGSHNPAKFWEPPKERKVYWMKDFTKEQIELIRGRGYHGGRTLDNGVDVGLLNIMRSPNVDFAVNVNRLKEWISMIQWEGRSMRPECRCMIWCPGFDEALIRQTCGDNLVIVTPEESRVIADNHDTLPKDSKL
jgi:hypothetical protein